MRCSILPNYSISEAKFFGHRLVFGPLGHRAIVGFGLFDLAILDAVSSAETIAQSPEAKRKVRPV